MALSPSAPTSPLPRQLLRYVSSQLVAALNRPAPAISLPSGAARGVDVAAFQRLRAASRGAAPSPKGRPGAPRPGSGGHVHATPPPATATTTAARAVMQESAPPPLAGLPVQGSGGETHAEPAAATASVVIGGPAQGSGNKVDAGLVAASLGVQRPKPPPSPRQGSGGGGGIHH